MRWLLQTPRFDSFGGTQTYVRYLGRELQARGHDVVVQCVRARPDEPMRGVVHGLSVVRFETGIVPDDTHGASLAEAARRAALAFPRAHMPDRVVATFPYFVTGTKAAWPRVPLVFVQPSATVLGYEHGARLAASARARRAYRLIARSYEAVERDALAAADLVLVQSRGMRAYDLVRHGADPRRLREFAPGVDPARFRPRPRDTRLLAALGFDARDRVIVCVSRLCAYKNVAALLAQLPRVVRAHPTTRLVLVGDGDERPALARLAARLGVAARVRFVGARPDPERYLALAELHVLPSMQEGFGVAQLEALACGVPIIAFRTGAGGDGVTAIEDILAGSGAGLAATDEAELGSALKDLLGDDARRASMAASALRRARAFTWSAACDRLALPRDATREPRHAPEPMATTSLAP
jgi:glycosyltransferase involved in cell wall biosynthesis